MKLMITVSQDEDRAVREAAEREGRTISDFLRARIFGGASAIGGEKIDEIAALQRACISILAQMWGETNPEAATKIRNIAAKAGAKI